jgi:hypothetical protein
VSAMGPRRGANAGGAERGAARRTARRIGRTAWLPGLLGLGLVLGGCLGAPRFYAEPTPGHPSRTLAPPSSARPLHLTVEAPGRAGDALASRVSRTVTIALLRSGRVSALAPSPDGVDHLAVTVAHPVGAGAIAGAVAQGSLTGLTFGAIGARTADTFVFTALYTPAGGEPVRKEYRRAVYGVIGNRAGPKGAPALSSFDEALDRVIEDVVLTLLRDLDAEAGL